MRDEKNIYPDFGSELPPNPIGSVELSTRLENELHGWRLIESPLPENPFKVRKELYKKYCFESFHKVVDYLDDLKEICDVLPHHPRIENVWATLEVYLSTWAINYDISYKDIQLAKNMDKLYAEKYKVSSSIEVRKLKENNHFVDEIKFLIEKDEVKAAIKKLDVFFKINKEIPTPTIFPQIKGRYAGYDKKVISGTLSPDESIREINLIREGLLNFVDQMTESFG